MKYEFRKYNSLFIPIYFLSFFIPQIINAINEVDQPNIMIPNMTRKVAEILCRTVYGPQDLFDKVIYFDTDGERSSDIYIFSKNNDWLNNKSGLLDSIYYYRSQLFTYADSIMNVDSYLDNKSKVKEKLSNYRKMTDYYLKLSTRPHDFISVYTSASKNHKPIIEYREGLPELYVMKYDIDQIFLDLNGSIPNEIDFYYFGPLKIYVSDKNREDKTVVSG